MAALRRVIARRAQQHPDQWPENRMMDETVEASVRRKVTVVADEDEAVGRFNEQDKCPLFTLLPREIREMIWALATAPYEDPAGKFDEKEYFYRPGHTARLKSETALLFTCRRVWLEANAMPMLQAEHSYYYERAAPDARTPDWMAKLTPHNRENFGHLRLFVQMYLIERLTAQPGAVRSYFLRTPPRPADFQPRMLHVTVRHTDWWNWEDDQPLRLKYSWVEALLNSPDLRSTETLKLELETVEYKVNQLQPIVEHIKRLQSLEKETHIIGGLLRRSKFELTGETEVYTWEGPADINNQSHNAYRDGRTKLKYHVVTLTWKLKFPDLPQAVVSKVRRVPRMSDAAWQRMMLRKVMYSNPFDPRLEVSAYRTRGGYGGVQYISVDEPGEQPIPLWKRQYAEMRLQQISMEQAMVHEMCRRLDFVNQLVDWKCKDLRAKWTAEGSLLKIEN